MAIGHKRGMQYVSYGIPEDTHGNGQYKSIYNGSESDTPVLDFS
jgi:hypothetical protein